MLLEKQSQQQPSDQSMPTLSFLSDDYSTSSKRASICRSNSPAQKAFAAPQKLRWPNARAEINTCALRWTSFAIPRYEPNYRHFGCSIPTLTTLGDFAYYFYKSN